MGNALLMARKPKGRLEYYAMYPAHFNTDENVSGMTDSELGLYLMALNHSWMNRGLPVEDEEVERVMPGKRSRKEFAERWPRVRRCFVVQDGRLVNPRQEQERAIAHQLSSKRSQVASAKWEQVRCKTDAIAFQKHPVCTGDIDIYNPPPTPPFPFASPKPLDDLVEEYWAAYPSVDQLGGRKNKGLVERWYADKLGHLDDSSRIELHSKIMSGLTAAKNSVAWGKDGGRFIPAADKFLERKNYEDDFTPAESAGADQGFVEAQYRAAREDD